jgi:hypothetical protein
MSRPPITSKCGTGRSSRRCRGARANHAHGMVSVGVREIPRCASDACPAWRKGQLVGMTVGGPVSITAGATLKASARSTSPALPGPECRSNAARGNNPVGFINPQLYASPAVLNDITQGNNGDFAAAPGWDACTGLGSPDGTKVAQLFFRRGLSDPYTVRGGGRGQQPATPIVPRSPALARSVSFRAGTD